ncbi:ABC transporter ATP-binding protein [Rhodoferax sediminis]|uniref:ABC transporter ATP-binding protein n=1 Tax=Rhodoferax sediminis TaxID=2509614 RepID=A0A515DDJ7_9BURK|nr:ABC transporter ATP-binding protein [Rhodoferax sediminis]QDL38483.1 ABC transporter ATP-binding protein [Rhodoferax sediminis]
MTIHRNYPSLVKDTTLSEGASQRAPVKISFQGVSKTYGSAGRAGNQTLALDRLDVDIKAAEIVTVLGPTGCGKSSTLNLIAGFERPSTGSLLLDNQLIDGPGPDRAVVFQQPSLFPWLNVLDNVTLGVKCRGISRDTYAPRAAHLLQEVGLAGFERHYPYQLSGGMQQRVQIARALISEPKVLLLDEPFGALDYQTRIQMQELLLQLWQQHQQTIFFITHDVSEAIFVADRVLVMSRRPGRIKLSVDVHAPKPRDADFLSTPEFVELQRELLHAVQEEVYASSGSRGVNAKAA